MMASEQLLMDTESTNGGGSGFYRTYSPSWMAILRGIPLVHLQAEPQTRLGLIINELEATQHVAGYVFKPTDHAIRSAKFYLIETYARMLGSFPTPSFVRDGERGITIKWTQGRRTVRLNCFADPCDADYVYYENGEYDVEDGITPDKLKARLEWLTQHEREPAR